MNIEATEHLIIGNNVFTTEIDGLNYVAAQLDESFSKAVSTILANCGRTIVCGMGKSGIIGKKIAASLASTGTPAFSIHPGEAFHGDLGMITSIDVFIAISYSGETDELIKLLPFLKENGNTIIALTGQPQSTLAQHANIVLNIHVPEEACPWQLAPTTSTTATLVMGDALTVALMKAREFQPQNFARFHPGGSLGRRLLNQVYNEMFTEAIPVVDQSASFEQIIDTVTAGKQGMTLVKLDNNRMGIITDGDIRRAMKKYREKVFTQVAKCIGTATPVTIQPDASVDYAYQVMERHQVNQLLVCTNDIIVGIFKK